MHLIVYTSLITNGTNGPTGTRVSNYSILRYSSQVVSNIMSLLIGSLIALKNYYQDLNIVFRKQKYASSL